ncbi:MAG TPA: choice-of-anchor E domain-containing protein [Puia sp.]|nr:choice-of-anchor E domain-containing protein [Puia sp.]
MPATPIIYYASFPATNQASTTITFPQFNPAIGTLACISLNDTVSGVTTTSALNKAPNPVTYKFQLTVSNDLEGPPGGGLSISNTYNRTYGPSTLQRLGFPGDTITYGPDTIFNSEADFASTSSNTAPYLGTGTVDFTYSLSGGVVSTQGGLNYTAGPTTFYWGNYSLTYYWCPALSLSTTIRNFTATPEGNAIFLQWITDNQQPNTQYDIQVSQDGKSFYSAGQAEGDASSTGASAKYQYQYNPDPSYVGKLYFRIEETDPSGKISLSTILIIDPGASGNGAPISFQTFPNPATNSLQVLFNSGQTGRFLVELVATSGQIVRQKAVTLAGSNQITLDLSPQPARGLYFLRTSDLTHNRNFVSKVFIN